ncbi:MAG: hypothetical protein ACK53V_22465, partial [Planctomycetota bacterium]
VREVEKAMVAYVIVARQSQQFDRNSPRPGLDSRLVSLQNKCRAISRQTLGIGWNNGSDIQMAPAS